MSLLPTSTYYSLGNPEFVPMSDTATIRASTLTLLNTTGSAVLSSDNNDLVLNGFPITTTSNLAEWAEFPAFSTLNMAGNNLINAGSLVGDQLNVNLAYISDLRVFNQTTENYGSTINLVLENLYFSSMEGGAANISSLLLNSLTVNSINLSSISVLSASISSILATSLASDRIASLNLNVSSINGETPGGGTQSPSNWASYPAGSDVILAGKSIKSGSGSSGSNITITSSNLMTLNSAGFSNSAYKIDPTSGCASYLKAGGGLFGEVDISADPGILGLYGRIGITANGGSIGGVGTGGLINITANTPLGLSNATSAIKLNAAGINSYAGIIPSIGSLAGYNFIYGTLGVNICTGIPAGLLPNTAGTTYLYGTNGIVLDSDTYVRHIYPYSDGLTANDLLITGRSLPAAGVRMSNIKSISMDSPAAISNCSRIVFNTGGTLSNVSKINGVVYPPPFVTPCNLYVLNVNSRLATISSLTVSSINGSKYSPGGGGSAISTFSTLATQAFTVSSINGSAYSPGGGGSAISTFSTIFLSSINLGSNVMGYNAELSAAPSQSIEFSSIAALASKSGYLAGDTSFGAKGVVISPDAIGASDGLGVARAFMFNNPGGIDVSARHISVSSINNGAYPPVADPAAMMLLEATVSFTIPSSNVVTNMDMTPIYSNSSNITQSLPHRIELNAIGLYKITLNSGAGNGEDPSNPDTNLWVEVLDDTGTIIFIGTSTIGSGYNGSSTTTFVEVLHPVYTLLLTVRSSSGWSISSPYNKTMTAEIVKLT